MDINKKKLIKEKFIELYPKKVCNITETCKAVNINRSTFYEWVAEDKEFKKLCNDAEESMLDYAETQLMKNIKDGKETSLIFYLKCKGKKRGYIDKYEFEHSGNVGINIKVDWGKDESNDQ